MRHISLCISNLLIKTSCLDQLYFLLSKEQGNSWSALVVNNQPIRSRCTDRESCQKQDVREQQRYQCAGITLRNDKYQEDNKIKKNKKWSSQNQPTRVYPLVFTGLYSSKVFIAIWEENKFPKCFIHAILTDFLKWYVLKWPPLSAITARRPVLTAPLSL